MSASIDRRELLQKLVDSYRREIDTLEAALTQLRIDVVMAAELLESDCEIHSAPVSRQSTPKNNSQTTDDC